MFYRILRWINAWFALIILWIFIGGFLLGMGFMFAWPQITLLLLFASLASLALAVLCGSAFRSLQRTMARRAIHSGHCPLCGATPIDRHAADEDARCPKCGAEFDAVGDEISKDPRQLK